MNIREQLLSLDAIDLHLGSGTGPIMSVVLALIMFGIALEIKPESLKNIFVKPKSIITGILLQWVGLPLVTFLLILAGRNILSPMVCLGMLLVASCPGGNISNFISSFSKGNIELSVSMTAVSTVCAPFVTPFNFWFWGNQYLTLVGKTGQMTIPHLTIPFWNIFSTVFLILGVPIVLGMLCSIYLPKVTEKIKKPFSVFSILVFVAMVIGMFLPNWELFVKYIIFIFIIVLIHNACAFGTGYLGSTLMGLPRIDRRSITIEVGIQNSGLGLTLLLNPAIFPPSVWDNPETGIMYGGMLFVTCWWGIWHIISGLALGTLFRNIKVSD